ncbi:hypothetical protein DTO006G1_2041 [Penicillium roqueforti]|nr:hypothetical protein CBS147354_5754 [Penicillium roqueforti]KAI2762902.1 hypothetical protein DTO006G1_2041 [Penicillium roqueforti]KAI3113008.1 hypothetical protein CBS147333_3000 [Penicillium roqueforti]KAI3133744.1 hypothetical protein CBS147326_4856 [Penicillium roqueforti]KAI3231671.1 hypothetical protein DTO012A7_5282 [Penicillium roqueforti]
MDDSFPQTDCEARTDREARSPSPPSSANYSTDTTTSPVKPAGSMGFFAAVGDSSSSAPSSSSPTSDGSFAPRVDGLTQVITAIGLTFGRESGSPDELSFGDDGGPDRGAEVSVAAETVRQVRFLLRYGDYAGMVWNVLRRISRLSNTPLPDTVVAFDPELDIGEEDQAVEELSGPPGAWQILRRLVDLLNNREGIQIDESMARSAIKAYVLRNKLCHSSNLRGKCPRDIARDAGKLGDVLPDELHQDRATWERIVRSFGDLRSWMADAPLPGELIFHDAMPNSMQQEELMRDLNRGLRHDRLDQMYVKDGEAKRLNQLRPGRVGSDPLPYVPTMEPTYSPSRR